MATRMRIVPGRRQVRSGLGRWGNPFRAIDLAPAARQYRPPLRPLTLELLQLTPGERLLLLTRPQHQRSLWRHASDSRQHFLARSSLLGRNIEQLVALALGHLRHVADL